MPPSADLLPGTLDLLILKAVSLGRLHGYGVLLRIEQISGGAILVQQGALYPALYRLEQRGLLETEWGTSENNRRAKFYRLTAAGRKQLREETVGWNRLVAGIACGIERHSGGRLMRALVSLRAWIRDTVVARGRFERDMADEFRSHIAHRADDLERAGLTRHVALRTARLEFGSVDGFKEMGREARGLRLVDEAPGRLQFRVAQRARESVAVGDGRVTLALGIGISSGVFAVMDAVSLRARVEGDTRTFVRILSSYGTDSTRPGFPSPTTLSDYLAYRDGSRALRALAGWQKVLATIDDDPAPVGALLVTCEFFDVYAFGRPVAGRALGADDCSRESLSR